MSGADYIAAVVLILLAIAVFLNVRNGTLGQWLRSKFLGLAPGQQPPASIFSAAP